MTFRTPLTVPHSERLRFRLMDENDADLLWELDQDPEVMRFLNDGKPTPREEFDEYNMPRMMRFTDPATGCGMWEIADRQSGEYLGWILVRQYGFETDYLEPGNIELGWRLKRAYWGRRITTEAAQAVIDVLKHMPHIEKFSAQADADNLGSIGVMKNLGMQFIDNRIHYTPKGNYPVVYYELAAGSE